MKKTKIVLVEDDEILAKVLHEELVRAGFSVVLARDGEAGLSAVRRNIPDVVLLDLMLPKKHGFEVLAELKKASETRGIPVIILTALGDDEEIKKGFALGANDYIVKSQHAIAEIIEKIKGFFAQESHPEGKHKKAVSK
jgi:DNA-binding response OmpR family regulator